MISLDAFVARYNGKKVDQDGAYGAQCVDLIRQYVVDCFGKSPTPTGNGCATGYFLNFNQPLPQIFDKVANNPNDKNQIPPKGSVMIYAGTPTNRCGHTAIVVESNLKTHTIFEQNAYPVGSACHTRVRDYIGVMGWLQPKGVNMDELNALRADNANLRAQSASLANQVAGLTQQVNDLGKSLQAAQKVNTDMQAVLDSTNETLAGKLAQIEDLNKKLELATKPIDEPVHPKVNLWQWLLSLFKKKG